MPSPSAISFSAAAVSSACARLSSAQGPAISASGRSLPKLTRPTDTTLFGAAPIRSSHQPALLDGRRDEGGEERVRLEGARLQLRAELHAHEPAVAFELPDL